MAIGADGKVTISTALDNTGLEKGIGKVSGSLGGLKNVLGGIAAAVGVAFGVKAIIEFGKASITAAKQMTDAMTGLKSIMDGQGRSFAAANDFINEYISDGLVPATEAITAYKNLALRGYDDSQIRSVMVALKESATYGRQSSYTLGQAVASAAEGLKNENSILVDNAGVTKNVAKMWDDYAKSIGTTSNNLTQQQKIQAEVNGILEETKFQTGDAAKAAGTFSGQLMQLEFGFNNLKVAFGNALIPIARAILPGINAVISALTRLFNVFAKVSAAIFGGAASEMQAFDDTAASAGGVSDAITDATAKQNALTDATKKTAKAQHTLSIDALNVVNDPASSGGSSGTAGSAGGGAAIVTPEIIDTPATRYAADEVKKAFDSLRKYFTTTFAPAIQAMADAWDKVKSAATDAANIIGDALKNFYNTALKPLVSAVKDFTENVVNKLITTLSPIIASIVSSGLVQFAKDVAFYLDMIGRAINDYVIPMFDFMEGVFEDVMDSIASAWSQYGEPIIAGWEAAKEGMRALFTNIYETIIKPIFEKIVAVVNDLWDNHFKGLWDNITGFFGAFAEAIMAVWNNALLPWWNWLVNVFGPIVSAIFDNVAGAFSTAFGIIADIASGLIRTLKGVMEFITGVFTGNWSKAWSGIKNIFGGVWDGLWAQLKGTINMITGGINAMIRGVVTGINTVVRAINSINFTVPDWVPGLGGKSIGFSLKEITAPQIPQLAQGAVLPANRPFLAMVGDQKNGTNIEAPLDTIVTAFKQALADINTGSDTPPLVETTVTLDGMVLLKSIQKAESRTGYDMKKRK